MNRFFHLAFALALLPVGACGPAAQSCPPVKCPATYLGVVLEVTTSPATTLNGVQATLTGPVTATMSCQANETGASCIWPGSVPVTPGGYSLAVSAPGHQTQTSDVEVTVPAAATCECAIGSLQPSSVSLGASDAGATD